MGVGNDDLSAKRSGEKTVLSRKTTFGGKRGGEKWIAGREGMTGDPGYWGVNDWGSFRRLDYTDQVLCRAAHLFGASKGIGSSLNNKCLTLDTG